MIEDDYCMLDIREGKIEIPVIISEDPQDKTVCIVAGKESERMLGMSAYGQGKNWKEAKESFFECVRAILNFYKERSDELDKWKPFQHGPWGKTGGSWFLVYGIGLYFRHGKEMIGGWYVPFTKLNITLHNHWRKRKNANS